MLAGTSPTIRQLQPEERPWLREQLTRNWGSTKPEIRRFADNGLPIRDALVLELALSPEEQADVE